jgi:hypothetical protein
MPNKLKSGKNIEDLLKQFIDHMQKKNVYYNHEIFSHIINISSYDIKLIFDNEEDIDFLSSKFIISNISLNIDCISELFENEFNKQPTQHIDLYNNTITTISSTTPSIPIILSTIITFNNILVTKSNSTSTKITSNITKINSNNNTTDILEAGLIIYIKHIINRL